MSKLLMGVQRRENCLLESPTGTGKTLALLSAALAWQRQQREHGLAMESDDQVGKEEENGNPPMNNEGPDEPLQSFDDFRYVEPKADSPVELAYEDDDSVVTTKLKTKPPAKEETRPRFYGDNFDDDAFESPKKKRQKAPKPRARTPHDDDRGDLRTSDSEGDGASSPASSNASPRMERDPSEELGSPASSASGGADFAAEASGQTAVKSATAQVKPIKQEKKPKRRRVPRVFFCSRTHSQLNQVVAELRTCRTAFQDTSTVGIGEDGEPFSMALLASRKSTCINKEACIDPKGVDDACKRLLKEKACTYHRRAKRRLTRLPPVWDVEEAIALGRRNQTCPYYTARDTLSTADLVLCPYNYIVDPGVREVMGINLKDAVVIFDEAHNLEDCAREAASAKLSLRSLFIAAGEMHRLGLKCPSLAPAYDLLRGVIVGIQNFLEEQDVHLTLGSYEKAHKVFKGTEALGLMQSRAGVTAESLEELKEALKLVVNESAGGEPYAVEEMEVNAHADSSPSSGEAGGVLAMFKADCELILGENEGPGEGHRGDVLSSGSLRVTSSLVTVLGFLLAEGMKNVDHYKMVVLRERGPWEPASSRGRRGRNRAGAASIAAMETYLCFWCLSASTCFSEIDKQVHSIVLTSGTLSPLDSFAGELGIDFPHQLEAPHVINVRKQCLVTSIGYFGGVSLDARYTNQHDLKFQDALGNALLQHARVVPGGILVFFPSYALLEKVHERWKVTGLLRALDAIKGVHLEPRGQGKIDIVLTAYYEDIANAKESKENMNSSPTSRTGALMFAVARGKVSEGIDFSDDACRMCVVIGIPYPSSKDLQVVLKKEYQDQRRTRNPRLVGGRAWYNLQAFRAVNQAVGRCIRHRNDFGAIVLCDPRYGLSGETTASLSKWVRSSVKQCKNVEASLPHVDYFFRSHQPEDEQIPVGTSPDPSLVGSHDGAGGQGGGSVSRGPVQAALAASSAVKGSPEPVLVQQSLSQMFKNSSADRGASPLSDATNGAAASVFQNTSGRAALHPLSRGNATQTLPSSNPETSALHTDPEPSRLHDRMWCRMGASFVMIPTGDRPTAESARRVRPRRVLVRQESHLYRTNASLPVPACVEIPTTSSGVCDWWENPAALLEFPREGWTRTSCMTEGDGRWVAEDGLVYAPLFCSCTGCGSVPIGEVAVAAGLHGQDLIGRAWFYSTRVHFNGVVLDETSPTELLLPTHAAMEEHSRTPYA
eukprot:g13412.t1